MNETVEKTCARYQEYWKTILCPAANSFRNSLESDQLQLHEVFGTNLFVAHAIDYLAEVRKADGEISTRSQFVQNFDELYFVEGARFQNIKFRLVDAVNNALKHIEICADRYHDLVAKYGSISFQCLSEVDGRILCLLDGYRFDYCRVILCPVLDVLVDWQFDDLDDVLEFARGNCSGIEILSDESDDDPIDQMIDYCNPVCLDCGEGERECLCATYIYDGDSGEFAPIQDDTFDFDSVMCRISGAYQP